MEDKITRGGRPRKKLSEVKKYVVSIRYDTEGYYSLKAKARSARMPLHTFLHDVTLQGVVIARNTKEELVFYRQLAGMAVNVNQLAHKANAEGLISVLPYLKGVLDNVNMVTDKLINK